MIRGRRDYCEDWQTTSAIYEMGVDGEREREGWTERIRSFEVTKVVRVVYKVWGRVYNLFTVGIIAFLRSE